MMTQRYSTPQRQERYQARAKRARFWAWPVRIAMIGCVGAAIWQEPALSPKAHAMLKDVAGRANERLERSGVAQSYLTALSGPAVSATDK
ncbi:hypothetical protein [Roseovarius marisflavi]|nr:hypothetical protein [Roseovarius marisflavi]